MQFRDRALETMHMAVGSTSRVTHTKANLLQSKAGWGEWEEKVLGVGLESCQRAVKADKNVCCSRSRPKLSSQHPHLPFTDV